MHGWPLWSTGDVVKELSGLEPLLAQWQKHTHPAQRRLHAYLDDLTRALQPLPEGEPLYLDLTVDAREPRHLLRHHDVENYLTPLFGPRWLAPADFVLVRGRRRVGGGSVVRLGRAKPLTGPLPGEGWGHVSCVPRAPAGSTAWKHEVNAALAAQVPAPLPDGAVEVILAWRGGSPRGWCGLWKPTGDAMGPVLGYAAGRSEFNLNEGRIVRLEFHRVEDGSVGRSLRVGMWWRLVAEAAGAGVADRRGPAAGTSGAGDRERGADRPRRGDDQALGVAVATSAGGPRRGRAPDWTPEGFETLLQISDLTADDVARLLPRRSVDAIEVVRQGVHSYHLGPGKLKLSQMMSTRLGDSRRPVSCPVCGAPVTPSRTR